MSSSEAIIQKTLSQTPLTDVEITALVTDYTTGKVTGSEMTIWLQAVMKNGLNHSETAAYTDAILNSGKQLDFSHLPGFVVDKHSTGGVGDKVSFILGPILAACGCYVPMVAGRGLGHTGGTIDKLETIPGYNCEISSEKFGQIVEDVGISIMCQTSEICPADGKIYALRDVTNTVASYPLICGSIMSKKIAEGIKGLVLDIKTGNGAFMSTLEDAQNLGELLKATGAAHGVNVYPAITNMDEPLGNMAGNWCEVVESVQCLKGDGPTDLMEVVFHLGKKALEMAQIENPHAKMEASITDGSAFQIFKDMVTAHGGDADSLTDINLHTPKYSTKITAIQDGYISNIDTLLLGNALVEMGAGRQKITDIIDPSAGFTIHVKRGDFVHKGDNLFTSYCTSSKKLEIAVKMMTKSIEISSESPKLPPLIIE
ncbi:MAG: thymidine phosphorylase [Candidatus Marinimicrobia bacterium]|nr:thymidine phosphorylase [Candidatus Neomarinimicrobiota bacterium]